MLSKSMSNLTLKANANAHIAGRIHSLDGLRAIAILLVLIGHTAGTLGSPDFLKPFHGFGNYGVRFFFVISGFLITYLLLAELDKNQTINLKGFFYRRVLRIFPAYYFYLLTAVLLGHYGYVEILEGDLLHAATYTMNYQEQRGWHLNHTWSLAVEEQFYLLWPLALLFLDVKKARLLLCVIVLVVPVVRFIMWYEFDMSPSAMTRQFQAVSDALALGCLLAFILQGHLSISWLYKVRRWILWSAAIILLVLSALTFLLDKAYFYVVGQSLANFGAVIIVYLCISNNQGWIYFLLNHKVPVFIGTISYSLYLWQEPFLNSYETHTLQSFPVNIFLAFACAIASYYLIEKPFLKLKK